VTGPEGSAGQRERCTPRRRAAPGRRQPHSSPRSESCCMPVAVPEPTDTDRRSAREPRTPGCGAVRRRRPAQGPGCRRPAPPVIDRRGVLRAGGRVPGLQLTRLRNDLARISPHLVRAPRSCPVTRPAPLCRLPSRPHRATHHLTAQHRPDDWTNVLVQTPTQLMTVEDAETPPPSGSRTRPPAQPHRTIRAHPQPRT
jgi:hypothetical protein